MRVGSTDESNSMSAMSVERLRWVYAGGRGGNGARDWRCEKRDYFLTMTSARWKERSASRLLLEADS